MLDFFFGNTYLNHQLLQETLNKCRLSNKICAQLMFNPGIQYFEVVPRGATCSSKCGI